MDTIDPIIEKPTPFCAIPTTAHESLINLWGGLHPPIHIIYDAYDEDRWKRDLKRIAFDNTNFEDKLPSILDKFGPLLYTGDVYAMQHIGFILKIFYGPDEVIYTPSKDFRDSKVKNENIVLIGGCCGNRITREILGKAGLDWLFVNPDNDFYIRRFKDDTEPLYPFPLPADFLPSELKSDVGVFFRCSNPFNPKRLLFGAMGACSWGTQGAAAIACAGESATEMLEGFSKNRKVYDKTIDCIGFVQVEKNVKNHSQEVVGLRYSDPHLTYQFIGPGEKGKKWQNPGTISNTLAAMMRSIIIENTSVTLSKHLNPAKVVLTLVLFMLATIAVTTAIVNKIGLYYTLPVAVVCGSFGLWSLLEMCFSVRYPTNNNKVS